MSRSATAHSPSETPPRVHHPPPPPPTTTARTEDFGGRIAVARIGLRGNMIRMGAGAELVARIVADMRAHGLEDGREVELLALAEGLADRLAELEECVEDEGLSTVLQSGRVVMNPAVAEARQTRTALARVLNGVSMTEGRAKDPQKVKAAQARWLEHNIARGRVSG